SWRGRWGRAGEVGRRPARAARALHTQARGQLQGHAHPARIAVARGEADRAYARPLQGQQAVLFGVAVAGRPHQRPQDACADHPVAPGQVSVGGHSGEQPVDLAHLGPPGLAAGGAVVVDHSGPAHRLSSPPWLSSAYAAGWPAVLRTRRRTGAPSSSSTGRMRSSWRYTTRTVSGRPPSRSVRRRPASVSGSVPSRTHVRRVTSRCTFASTNASSAGEIRLHPGAVARGISSQTTMSVTGSLPYRTATRW